MGAQGLGLSHPVDPDHEAEPAGPPGLHAGQGVLEDCRLVGVHSERAGGSKIGIGSGLSSQMGRFNGHAIDECLEEVVDADHLAGKPAPDTYLAAARALGVDPDRAAVFEDALSGVEAGRTGGFGFVVGVDRVGQAEDLRAHGADTVVTDLAELLGRP